MVQILYHGSTVTVPSWLFNFAATTTFPNFTSYPKNLSGNTVSTSELNIAHGFNRGMKIADNPPTVLTVYNIWVECSGCLNRISSLTYCFASFVPPGSYWDGVTDHRLAEGGVFLFLPLHKPGLLYLLRYKYTFSQYKYTF